MQNKHDQAIAFFQQYVTVFDSGDMARFVTRLAEPFASVRPDGRIQAMPDHQAARRFFEQARAAWVEDGYDHFATSDYEVVALGERSLLVTLNWAMLSQQDTVLRQWRQSYNLVKLDQVWKLAFSTFHSAS